MSQILIDDFSTNQALIFAIGAGDSTSNIANTAGSDILGSERDIEVSVVAGAVTSGEVTNGAFNFSVAAATTGEGLIMWDGPDGLPSAADIDPVGLGGVDMTQSGTLDSFRVNILSSDQPGTMILSVYTDGGNFSSATVAIPVSAVALDFVIPFNQFVTAGGAGADFTNVGAVTLFVTGIAIDTRISLIQAESSLSASMTDALLIDNDSDTNASPGDTIRYTAVVSNPDDSSDANVSGVNLSIPAISGTTLVVGSVTTSQGTVINGNTAGDSTVNINVGSVSDGSLVTMTFDVIINSDATTQISAQGLVQSDTLPTGVSTDDPDTGTANDATVTPIVKTTLGDFVWNDLDGDGVQDGGEPGFEGVTLDAYWDVNNDGMVDGGDLLLATTTTSGGGAYNFSLANYGTFLVDVTDTGGVLSNYTLTTVADPIQVAYPPGSTANDLDFGYILIPELTISDVSQNEGDSGTTGFIFDLSLSSPAIDTVSLDFSVTTPSATPGIDYVEPTITHVEFTPGQTSQTIVIDVIGDTQYEANEEIIITLTLLSSSVWMSDGIGIGTIINDDSIPSITISDVSLPEGDSGNSTAAFTVQMSNTSELDVSVDFVTAENTATADVDYVTTAGTLMIPANSLQGTVNVSVIGDYTIESDEQFHVNLNNPVNATITDNSATGTILDDDLGVDLSLTMSISPTEIRVNGILTHHLIVTNNGPEDALDTFAELNLSPLLDYISSSSNQGVCTHSTGVISCDLGVIPANQTVNIFIDARVNGAGAVNSSATVYSSTSDDVNLANNNASAGVIADPLVIPAISDFGLLLLYVMTLWVAYRFHSHRFGKRI